MTPSITNIHIQAVQRVLEACASTPARSRLELLPLVTALTKPERWLFTFLRYVMGSQRWYPVDPSAYYLLPCSATQRVSFDDFVDLLRYYNKKRITPNNELELNRFLMGCTEQLREFYLTVLERPAWLSSVFSYEEMRTLTDVGSIDVAELFGNPKFKSVGWGIVAYPLTVTTVPHAELQTVRLDLVEDGANGYTYLQLPESTRKKFKKSLNLGWLKDRELVFGSGVLFGYADMEAGSYYPIDYFKDSAEYLKFARGKLSLPYPVRIERLERFIHNTYARSIMRNPTVYCKRPSQLEGALGTALAQSKDSVVLVVDAKHRAMLVPTVEHEGAVDGLWVEEGIVRGVQVWECGRKYNCGFDFRGKANALLMRPDLLHGKHVRFVAYEHLGVTAYAVKEVLWEKRIFRTKPLNGTRVERCIYCCRTEIKQELPGVCLYCYENFKCLLNKAGTEWFSPSESIAKAREACGWTPEWFNSISVYYRGYKLEVDDEGRARFNDQDEEAQRRYARYKKEGTGGRK